MLTPILKTYPLAICLGLAGIVSSLFGFYLASDATLPFGDGEGYACRAFALYGFLHTGQWANFWDLFTSPKQALAPLHYWLFFLLPQIWAGTASYIAIQLLSTYGLLAFSIWKMCQVLNRAEWAPAIFLLCAVQNLSLDYAYAFFMDMPFFASGVLALAWQMDAWNDRSFLKSFLSGLGVGLLFWIKPANALLFLGTYFIAEGIHLVFFIRVNQKKERFLLDLKGMTIHGLAVLLGFLPIFTLAFVCGAGQSIILLIYDNEVSDRMKTVLTCTGFMRFFYFPLCLSYFYQSLKMAILFIILLSLCSTIPKIANPPKDFPTHLIIPLVITYFILGESFSFLMTAKTMRSLLLILPILWILVFWLLEKYRLTSIGFSGVALCYASNAFLNLNYNLFFSPSYSNSTDIAPDNYQLEGSWLIGMPHPWLSISPMLRLKSDLRGTIPIYFPQGGKIGVNTERISLNQDSLFWYLNYPKLIRGEKDCYQSCTIFHEDGTYRPQEILGCNLFIIYINAKAQTNGMTAARSTQLLSYGINEWVIRDKMAQVQALPPNSLTPFGYEIIFNQPLTSDQIKIAMDAIGSLPQNEEMLFSKRSQIYGYRYSLEESKKILLLLIVKRFNIK